MGEFQKGKRYVHTSELYDEKTLGLGFVKKKEENDDNFVRVLPFGWIKQAKKEFPKDLMDLALNSNYKKIAEWFEKWFGK